MPNYLTDVKNTARGLKKGFTLLTDVTKIKTPPEEVEELHLKSQQIWIESGLSKTAEILPSSTIAKLALDRWSKTTGMEKEWFDNKDAAEAWLDGK